jgi:hypothetical protein
VEQKLRTLPKHMSSLPVFSGVRVTRSLVVCVYFVDCCLSLLYFFFWPLCCLFFFDIRILITSLWYLQTLLVLCSFLCLCFVSRVQMLHVFLDCPLLIVPLFSVLYVNLPGMSEVLCLRNSLDIHVDLIHLY